VKCLGEIADPFAQSSTIQYFLRCGCPFGTFGTDSPVRNLSRPTPSTSKRGCSLENRVGNQNPGEPSQVLYFQRTPYKTRQLPRRAQAGAGKKIYPSLPEFTHPCPLGSPQFPPSAWRAPGPRPGRRREYRRGQADGSLPRDSASHANHRAGPDGATAVMTRTVGELVLTCASPKTRPRPSPYAATRS